MLGLITKPIIMKRLLQSATLLALLSFTSCAKDGEDGPAGPAGNANVRSEQFTVAPGDWNSNADGLWFQHNSSLITSSIASTGTVLAYLRSGDTYLALPLPIASFTYAYAYGAGACEVSILGAGSSSQSQTFKIVVIASSGLAPEVNPNDYESVAEHYNL